MIEVTALSKRYGSHLAVNNVSFSIKDGEVVGFLGPNGAGKSTIMNILTGYISLTAGSASVDGYDIVESPQDAKRHIGYLPEIPPLYTDMTVREYLDFMFDLKKVKLPRKPHLDEICKLVMISDVQNRLIKNLSKGYRQRVGIAQALIGNPDTLILDEPTVGLDPKQIIEIRDLISRLGKNHTVILSSHILSEIQAVCDRIIIINGGRLVADGTPDELSKTISEEGALEVRIAGPKRDVLKTLSSIAGVESVDDLGSFEKGSCDYRITPEDKKDVRRAMFERLSERNWPILSMRDSTLTLEQIFLRLTNEDVSAIETAPAVLDSATEETQEEEASSLTEAKEENE